MKRFLTLLLVCLLIVPAVTRAETMGITNRVPITYVSDATGPADALSDDDTSTVWYGTVDPSPDVPTWTVLVSSQTVREIWIRNGARQTPGDYLAAGRASLLAVTVYYENQQVTTYRYRLNDAYSADTSRDFVNGYQRLLLPTAMRGVFCIELRVLETVGGSEIALTDILLSSGQPSQAASGVQMRAPAPTVRPADAGATKAPDNGNPDGTSPTKAPPKQPSLAPGSTLPPSYTQGSGQLATVLKQLGVRSGPGTGYDYVGSFFQGGEQVTVISKVWDPVNELYWDQVDIVSGKKHYRGYCVHEKRIDLKPSKIPDDQPGVPATILERTPNYYGPGTDYEAHNDQIFATTKGTVYAEENGYLLFDWYDGTNQMLRRAWVPANVVSIGQ